MSPRLPHGFGRCGVHNPNAAWPRNTIYWSHTLADVAFTTYALERFKAVSDYVFGLLGTQVPIPLGLVPAQCWPCGQDLWSILLIEQCLTAAAVGSDEAAKTVNAAKTVATFRSGIGLPPYKRVVLLPEAAAKIHITKPRPRGRCA